MAKTFHFEIQNKPTSRGTYPVYVRITEGRKHRRVKTSIELNRLSDWNPKPKQAGKYVRQSEPHYEKWNQALDDELEAIKNASKAKENQSKSLESLAKTIKAKGNPESFLEFAKAKVEEARASQSIGTYRHYLTSIQQLEGYLKAEGKSDLLFSEVDLAFLKGYESYLGEVGNQRSCGRTLGKNTKANYLKQLRHLVKEAEDEEKIEKNPFDKFKISTSEESNKVKLEQSELDRIIALDLVEGSMEWHTRNAFLFSLYCAGIRVADLMQLRWSNVEGGRIAYKMGKTDKVRNFELVADAEAILDKYRTASAKGSDYIFPFLSSEAKWAIESYKDYDTMSEDLKKALFKRLGTMNVILNRNLQQIAVKAGIQKHITMHCSRHSFANMAMKDNLPPSVIKMLLAHSDLKTTQHYMGSFSNAEADKALAKVFTKKNTKGSQEANTDLISALNNADKETLVTAFAELLNRLNQ